MDLTFPVKEELCAVPMEWEGLGCFTKTSPFTLDEQVLCCVEACNNVVWMEKIPQKTQEECLL